jgi:hypothetical protein
MTAVLAADAGAFGVGHIAVTAAITGALALAAAVWRLPREMLVDQLAVAVLSFAAVLLWRWSANMPQLNDDGLPGFSANDWLAPVLTYVVLAAYADLRGLAEPRRFAQTRALATIAALVANVVTI